MNKKLLNFVKGGTFGFVLGASVPFILASFLPISDYGKLMLAFSVLYAISTIFVGSLQVPFFIKSKENKPKAAKEYILAVIFITIFGIIFTYYYYSDYSSVTKLLFLGTLVALVVKTTLATWSLLNKETRLFNLIEVSYQSTIIICVATYYIYNHSLSLNAVLGAYLVAGLSITFIFKLLHVPIGNIYTDTKDKARSWFSLYIWQIIGISGSYFTAWGILILAAPLLTTENLAIMSLAIKLCGGISSIVFLISTFYFSELSISTTLSKEQKTEISTLVKFGCLISILIFASSLVLYLLLGSYSVYGTTLILVAIYSIGLPWLISSSTLIPVMSLTHKDRSVQIGALLQTVVIIIYLLLLKQFASNNTIIMYLAMSAVPLGFFIQNCFYRYVATK